MLPPGPAPVYIAEKPSEPTKFDLDFPGGTPGELVAAIQTAMGKPLNAIIPEEFADQKLPVLRMKHVDVSQLFQALEQASMKTVMLRNSMNSHYGGSGSGGGYGYSTYQASYGFRAKYSSLSDDTIWYFHVDKPMTPPGLSASSNFCRFYALGPYLDRQIPVDPAPSGAEPGQGSPRMRHLTVDDITTAIETGWKMMGETSMPKINFHKDTKLLIAVGDPQALENIDAVLKALEVLKTPPANPVPGQPESLSRPPDSEAPKPIPARAPRAPAALPPPAPAP